MLSGHLILFLCGDSFANSCSIIALTGLGGHAFGSFKAKGGPHMWLRDSLPVDLRGARILVYGYDSHLNKSDSFQSISFIANQFQDSLYAIRVGEPAKILRHEEQLHVSSFAKVNFLIFDRARIRGDRLFS